MHVDKGLRLERSYFATVSMLSESSELMLLSQSCSFLSSLLYFFLHSVGVYVRREREIKRERSACAHGAECQMCSGLYIGVCAGVLVYVTLESYLDR